MSLRKFATRDGIHEADPACDASCDVAMRLLQRANRLAGECQNLRDGKCSGVIPGSFIACGEGGNYCSDPCRLRAALRWVAREAALGTPMDYVTFAEETLSAKT
jgi:hypothetical protein